MNPRRLYRCRDDRRIAGVAAGIAEYLDLDPTVVRVAWVISTLLGGFTIVVYVILAFVIPLEPAAEPGPSVGPDGTDAPVADGGAAPAHDHRSARRGAPGAQPGDAMLVLGVLLVTFGSIALAGPILPGWIAGIHLGPAFVVALGVALIVGAARRRPVGP